MRPEYDTVDQMIRARQGDSGFAVLFSLMVACSFVAVRGMREV